MRDVLRAKGHTLHYAEHAGGEERDTGAAPVADGLAYLFGGAAAEG